MKKHPGSFRGIHLTGAPSGHGACVTGGKGDGGGKRTGMNGPMGTKVAPHSAVCGKDDSHRNLGTREPHKATRERGST